MPDFVFDDPAPGIPNGKTDLIPLGLGDALKHVTANEWNTVMQDVLDLRSAHKGETSGGVHFVGFASGVSAPVSGPGKARLRLNGGTIEASINGGAYSAFGSGGPGNGDGFTVLGKPTTGTGARVDISLGTNTVLGRVAGDITAVPIGTAAGTVAAGDTMALLAGRAGGQTLVGGTTGGQALRLRGASADGATKYTDVTVNGLAMGEEQALTIAGHVADGFAPARWHFKSEVLNAVRDGLVQWGYNFGHDEQKIVPTEVQFKFNLETNFRATEGDPNSHVMEYNMNVVTSNDVAWRAFAFAATRTPASALLSNVIGTWGWQAREHTFNTESGVNKVKFDLGLATANTSKFQFLSCALRTKNGIDTADPAVQGRMVFQPTASNQDADFGFMPNGTPAGATKATVSFWRSDFTADQTNYERAAITIGAAYQFGSDAGGTGLHRPVIISTSGSGNYVQLDGPQAYLPAGTGAAPGISAIGAPLSGFQINENDIRVYYNNNMLAQFSTAFSGVSVDNITAQVLNGGGSQCLLKTAAVTIATMTTTSHLTMQRRFQLATGSSVASASTITLAVDGNDTPITGTTTINYITSANWQTGAEVTLGPFAASLTLTHNAGSVPGGTVAMKFLGGDDLLVFAGERVRMKFDGAALVEVD